MSRRLCWGAIAALGVLGLLVCGTAFAGALPHANAAHKHRRKATECSRFRGVGGPVVGPVTIRAGTPPETFAEYGVGFSCNGAVSTFSVTSNKPFVPRSITREDAVESFVGGGVPAHEYSLGVRLDYESVICRKKGTSTFKCTFPAPKRLPKSVRITADFFSSAGCSTPMFSADVSLIGKTYAVTTMCQSG